MLDGLLQLRAPVEENFRRVFEDQDIVALTRANAPAEFQQVTPRVEIKLGVGAANGHRFVCPDGIARFDRWRFSLAIQCVTRPAGDGVNAINQVFVGRVRAICTDLAQVSWTDTNHFPNHRIAEPLRDAGESNTLQEDLEYTILNYSGTVCVRETSWPI